MSQTSGQYADQYDSDQWDDVEDDGVLDFSDTLDDDQISDPLDAGIVASEKWHAANRFGTTLAESRRGESLDQRLWEEEPDAGLDDGSPDDEDESSRRGYDTEGRSGRLFTDDPGWGDTEAELVAHDAGVDGGGASAEEAAVHVSDDPFGEGDGPLR